MSVFSASVPRNGAGRVRIVPILKRGYSLFSPAPINALTISAFNHIRAEEGEAANSDWLGNALCYAALAGSHAPDRATRRGTGCAQSDPCADRGVGCGNTAARNGSDSLRGRSRPAPCHGVVDDFHSPGKADQGHAQAGIDADRDPGVTTVGCCSNLASATVGPELASQIEENLSIILQA